MAHTMEKDVAIDPVEMGLLSTVGVVLAPDGLTDLIEQSPGALFDCDSSLGLDFHGQMLHRCA